MRKAKLRLLIVCIVAGLLAGLTALPAAAQEFGACCDEMSGFCYECEEEGCYETWLGPGSNCDQCEGVQGACCLPDGTCIDTSMFDCVEMQSGTWHEGENCASGICGCDWDPANPAPNTKWVQLPDETPFGMDIRIDSGGDAAPVPRIIADDFNCTQRGFITDVHFWGSWRYNEKGEITRIHLSIHEDLPVGDPRNPYEYSIPGEVLWTGDFSPDDFTEKLYVELPYGEGEWWYDYYTGVLIPNGDTQIWQYNICIDPCAAFHQMGTPDNPKIYWLDIQVDTTYGSEFGWKTSKDHWNDDAVFSVGYEPPFMWDELRYPPQHPNSPNSIDMAFVITSEEDESAKYVQRPDLSDLGMDVDATSYPFEVGWANQLLADDFNCATTGPITDIHIWGSWYHDEIPDNGPGEEVGFTLSIHEDDPPGPGGVDPCNLYSQPGEVLWGKYFVPGEFEVYEEANELMEGYYVPCEGYYEHPGDTKCYRYDFYINPLEAFEQQGDPCHPIIYWLDVQAEGLNPYHIVRFGWKTSPEHWMDDAVYAVGTEEDHGQWQELRYPDGHPYYPNSIDLAFKITTQEQPEPKPLVPHLKWSQPPVEILMPPEPLEGAGMGTSSVPPPIYCGWDEPSLREWIVPDLYFPCWDCPTQCYGDADCDTDVDADDLLIFTAANGSIYGDPDYDHCADFNRDFCVNHDDQDIWFNWAGKIIPSDCPEEGDIPGAQSWWVVADDFRCLGTMPVTSIHWWGSYLGWDGNEPAQPEPVAWRIGFWSNVPAGIDASYSHPRDLLWQVEVPADRVDVNNVGQDYFPYEPFEDTCFQYYVDLEPDEYFWQGDFELDTIDNIFWLSIAAVYPEDYVIDVNVWGWKTRPLHWMDDAVIFNLELEDDPYPGMPPLDPEFNYITPIERPIGELLESYDVTFELDTDPNWIKWEQPFTSLRHWPNYTDIFSSAIEYEGELDIYNMAADDWLCERRTPVSAIVWWGSYIDYQYLACEADQPMSPPIKPDYFLISVWTDVPASGGADCGDPDSCCCTHLWPGCDNPSCEASVCSYDPYCCDVRWDYICANEARTDSNCSECYGLPLLDPSFSHPGRKVWEYKAYDYDEVMVGYDNPPEYYDAAGDGGDESLEPVFRYSVRLPEEDWFCQPDVNSIYWISIMAVWEWSGEYPPYPWGWTNHKHVFADDGVEGWPDYDPDIWEWEELIDEQTGESWDLSFMLFTEPNICCRCPNFNLDTIVNFLDYAEFAEDWLWSGPAGGYATGDLNCDGSVDWYDVKIFVDQWLESCP